MIQRNDYRMLTHWGRITLAGIAAAVLLTGCGGGGGGGSTGGSSSSTATVTGQLKDTTTSNVLPNRTVTVENTTLSAVTDAQGDFTISSVPVTSITLSVTDSNGTSDGDRWPIRSEQDQRKHEERRGRSRSTSTAAAAGHRPRRFKQCAPRACSMRASQ